MENDKFSSRGLSSQTKISSSMRILRSSSKKKMLEMKPNTPISTNEEIITLTRFNSNFTETDKEEKVLETSKKNQFLLSHKIFFNKIPRYEKAKFSSKSYGFISSYAANTNQGQIRNYNEDRVSIILNVIKPNSRKNEDWPKVSFFGIYDGHGGAKCSDFLKENLHHYIFREPCFPTDPVRAITKGFEEAERNFLIAHKPKNLMCSFDKSGSCAICIIIMDDTCYIANLGDSRALYSENKSQLINLLSTDHKPTNEDEKKRITINGGYIYQGNSFYNSKTGMTVALNNLDIPWRIFPGRLSVSRAFGDIEAKLTELGGNPKVLICSPQIISFKINEKSDFIVIGSDGIFDKLSNKEIIDSVWATAVDEIKSDNIHEFMGKACDMIMKQSLFAGTVDNITCLVICFENMKNGLQCKFSEYINGLKKEYSPIREKLTSFNIDEIRCSLFNWNEKSIVLKENENLNFFHLAFLNNLNNKENKPKTSNNFIFRHEINVNLQQFTSTNEKNEDNVNNLVSCKNSEKENESDISNILKMNQTRKNDSIKLFRASLPNFNINQRMNKLSKNSSNGNLNGIISPQNNKRNNELNQHNLTSYKSLNVNCKSTEECRENFNANGTNNVKSFNEKISNDKILLNTANFSKFKILPNINQTNTAKKPSLDKLAIYKFTKTNFSNGNFNSAKKSNSIINTINLNFNTSKTPLSLNLNSKFNSLNFNSG